MRKLLITLGLAGTGLFSASLSAQQWGDYTLYAIQNQTTAYLVDTNGNTFHTWSGLSGSTAYSNYLLPGGTLLRTVKTTNSTFTGGGMAGRVQKVDYNGNITWDYTYSTTSHCSHHDICPMPNGNVLLIAYELKTSTEVQNAGCTSPHTMWFDHIVEVQPTGTTTGTIVWEWHMFDHLVQNANSSAANYQASIVNHPELININYNNPTNLNDWTHCNGIDYNPMLDQVVLSSHTMNEYYVIDHSTTTAEAASHTGGHAGKGGDFLYRWGNPAAYQASGTTIFNTIHDAHWIPEGSPRSGSLVGYNNNGISSSQSCFDIARPTYTTGYNYSLTLGQQYLPATYDRQIPCNGHNNNEGNTQQLPNGNMMVCVAQSGYFYEIDSLNNILWSKTVTGTVAQVFRYSACYLNNAAPAIPTISVLGNVLTSSAATTYQWYLNGWPISGATSQSYTATQSGIYVVRITDANGCVYMYSTGYDHTLFVGVNEIDPSVLNIFPNPTTGEVTLDGDVFGEHNLQVTVSDMQGRVVMEVKGGRHIDLSGFDNGVYYIRVISDSKGVLARKITLLK
jgi:hypothetical protein